MGQGTRNGRYVAGFSRDAMVGTQGFAASVDAFTVPFRFEVRRTALQHHILLLESSGNTGFERSVLKPDNDTMRNIGYG
jgi:hypothetical protein